MQKRYGEQAAQVTNEGFDAAGHAIGTAWAMFKIGKAFDPKSALKPTTLAKVAAEENYAELKAKLEGGYDLQGHKHGELRCSRSGRKWTMISTMSLLCMKKTLTSKATFIAADADGSVPFFWGNDSEGHLVLSDDAEIVKKGCGKSFAPFPKDEPTTKEISVLVLICADLGREPTTNEN
uniref:DUF3700 domain-containing protein n=1 Tax=Fagus sylvatica TaxID=28930 RepID=A0A2N9FXX3_FAGSY